MMESAMVEQKPTQLEEIARRREHLERSRREFLETINHERGPSRGEIVEQHDGYVRVTIVRGDAPAHLPVIRDGEGRP